MEKEEKKKEGKERYWAFIMYEDSRPENWREILEETMLPIAISPRHDMDIKDEETGEVKKPHYHVIVCFNGPTTYKRAMEIAGSVGANTVKRILSVKGMYDYFTHKWNDNKAKYSEEDIIHINGFNILEYGLTNREIERMKREIVRIIKERNIKEYCKLYDIFNEENNEDFCEIVSKNVMFFNSYLKSKKNIDEKWIRDLS